MSLKEQALNLYKKVFSEDSEEFARAFTQRYFDKCCRYSLLDGKMVGMLYLLDCTVCDRDKTYQAVYLYAAATLPEYRNRGVMTELINSVLNSENKTVITKPATKELFGFYEKFGFEVCSFKDDYPEKDFLKNDLIKTDEYISKREEILRNIPHITLSDTDFSLDGMKFYGNNAFIAAADCENGEIKEYIEKGVSLLNKTKPFAMWKKNDETKHINKIYFGMAMD